MKKVTTTVTYRLPAWEFCNHHDPVHLQTATNTRCRFCQKVGKPRDAVLMCLLHNVPLKATGHIVEKTYACIKQCAGFKEVINE